MREILFKAKRVDNGEWIYGVPVQHFDGDWQMVTHYSKTTIIPETVSQYIQLTDKNGIKVFEDDIVICNRFDNKKYQIRIKSILELPSELFGSHINWIEVIGNVFDNSELIGGK